jgi:hypothetical protein
MTIEAARELRRRIEASAAAAQATVAPLIAAESLSDEQVAAVTAAFPAWSGDGVKVAVGDLRVDEGVLYRCVQAHVTQDDWTPDKVPALWTPVRKVAGAAPDEWVQPVGASDAYRKGDRVLFQGATYESVIDANTWSPAAYPAGWKKV